ncbi:MAG TPA: PEP-CTERM sorting domain-containing protein [Tepidisphaeraceae bacterium]
MAAASTAQAAVATVVDNGSSQFGDMYGFALDFDRTQGISGSYTPVPASTPYSIDSVTVFRGNDTSTGTVYLGVYTGLSGSTLSGFQGVSNNTVTLGSLATARAPLTFNFSGINVTPETNPGSGGDVRYFAFQTGTTAITNYLGLIEGGATQGTQVPLARIDGDNGQFSDELSGVLAGNTATATLRTDRSPEYIATINAVPEPAALSLLGVAGLAMLRRRRGA